MFKLFKVAPIIFLLVACASNFGDNSKDALNYQQAINQNAIGQRIIVGGPIISYSYTNHSTQVEIANAPLNSGNIPSIHGNANERVIIIIPEKIDADRLEDVRISAIGDVREIARMNRYGNSTVIMINAYDYKIWRAANSMYDPANKQRYGYTYKFER